MLDWRLSPHISFIMEDENDLADHYFNLGYKQKEILSCLHLIYGKKLSSRQLKRILAQKDYRSRKNLSDVTTVLNHVEREL